MLAGRLYHQDGFTLIELLIALIVLSIGFAGYAALQLVGIRSVEDSYQRSQMTVLVEEMAERMRSNRQGLATYDGLVHTQGTDDCDTLGADVIDANNCERDDWVVNDDTCAPAEIAVYDAARVFCGYRDTDGAWVSGARNVSDLASIGIALNAATNTYDITGTWWAQETDRDDSKDQDTGDPDGADGDTQLMRQRVRVSVTP